MVFQNKNKGSLSGYNVAQRAAAEAKIWSVKNIKKKNNGLSRRRSSKDTSSSILNLRLTGAVGGGENVFKWVRLT